MWPWHQWRFFFFCSSCQPFFIIHAFQSQKRRAQNNNKDGQWGHDSEWRSVGTVGFRRNATATSRCRWWASLRGWWRQRRRRVIVSHHQNCCQLKRVNCQQKSGKLGIQSGITFTAGTGKFACWHNFTSAVNRLNFHLKNQRKKKRWELLQSASSCKGTRLEGAILTIHTAQLTADDLTEVLQMQVVFARPQFCQSH